MRYSDRTGLPIIKKTPPRPSSRCADVPPPALLTAVAQFNAGDFWHCHETLEGLWRTEPDPIRALYQGILLVGVGFLHLQRGNRRGAAAKLRQGLDCLEPFHPTCLTVDVAALLAALAPVREHLRRSPDDLPALDPPRILLVGSTPPG